MCVVEFLRLDYRSNCSSVQIVEAIAEEREGQRLLVEMGVDVLKLQAALDAHHPASTPSISLYPITNGSILVKALNEVVKRVSPKLVTFADLLWCVIECPDGDAGAKVKDAKSVRGQFIESTTLHKTADRPVFIELSRLNNQTV